MMRRDRAHHPRLIVGAVGGIPLLASLLASCGSGTRETEAEAPAAPADGGADVAIPDGEAAGALETLYVRIGTQRWTWSVPTRGTGSAQPDGDVASPLHLVPPPATAPPGAV